MIKSVELNQRHNRDPIPTIKSLEIALTSKCNYHCPYCGAYKVNDMSYKTLSISALRTILDQCSDLERIKLSGGEVTLRFDDCVEICRYCTSRGIELQLNTNATLLNSERINLLQDAGLNIIHISLDFIDSVKYCNYYNVPKSMFYTIIRNISLCCQSFDCVVETILFSETIDHLSEICRFVYELGVRNYELQSGIKQDNWDQGISSKDDIMNALRKLFSQSKEDMNIYLSCFDINPDSSIYKEYLLPGKKHNIHLTKCIDGQFQFHLHDNGDLIVCDLGFPVQLGNVFQDTIDCIIHKPKSMEIINSFLDHKQYCKKICIL